MDHQLLLARSGETWFDDLLLGHPYFFVFWVPVWCLCVSVYVLWATDPRSKIIVPVCSYHPGGNSVIGWRGQWGRRWFRLLGWAERWLRFPVLFSHGICQPCMVIVRALNGVEDK